MLRRRRKDDGLGRTSGGGNAGSFAHRRVTAAKELREATHSRAPRRAEYPEDPNPFIFLSDEPSKPTTPGLPVEEWWF